MSYLHPPPGEAPVVVVKDVGGYVDQYERQTAWYSMSNREVRLHECRSACTLALSLPNVCVYPDSQLKFHKAYNPETKEANDSVSDAMMAAYPPAVRERLGVLTRNYKVLTGSELIRLGVRDCNAPREPRVMIARARPKPIAPENPVSDAFGSLVAALTPPAPPSAPQVRVASVRAENAAAPQPAATPLPPQRPQELTREGTPAPEAGAPPQAILPTPAEPPQSAAPTANPVPHVPPAQAVTTPAAIPTPPPRPADMLAAVEKKPAAATTWAWGRPIKGAAPTLTSTRFTPFPYRLAIRG